MPEMCKYRREEIDESKIMWESNSQYPKKIAAKDGSSSAVWISPKTIFKRKLQDGNCSLDFHSIHHHVYDEYKGTFDDLAEVLFYNLAKGMGTRQKTMYNGEVVEAPLLDVAEYDLAIYTDKNGVEYRGCTSQNIVPEGNPKNLMVKGSDLLNVLGLPTKPKNSLPNHIKALEKYREIMQKSYGMPVVIDPNAPADLVINSQACWKAGNSDNHSGNIIYVQTVQPDGTLLLSVGKMIDNGSSWELSSPQGGSIDGSTPSALDRLFENAGGVMGTNHNGNPMIVFNKDPHKHNAFHIDAGFLNGHNKQLGDEKFEYEFDLAAYMLANPQVYDAIYQIEQQFDVDRVLTEVGKEKCLKYPPLLPETMRGLTEFKSNLLSQVVSNYYCYAAFTNCVGEVDLENPSELYTAFSEQMSALPLQPSLESYMNEFLNIAEQNQMQIDPEKLAAVDFMPKPEQTQAVDPTQGGAQ